jgi:hypothetical protein
MIAQRQQVWLQHAVSHHTMTMRAPDYIGAGPLGPRSGITRHDGGPACRAVAAVLLQQRNKQ